MDGRGKGCREGRVGYAYSLLSLHLDIDVTFYLASKKDASIGHLLALFFLCEKRELIRVDNEIK